MTEMEIKTLAAKLTDEEMTRLHKELVLRFGARMEQLTEFMREYETDIERIAQGGFQISEHDTELAARLADFALFYFVSGDNQNLIEDLIRERENS